MGTGHNLSSTFIMYINLTIYRSHAFTFLPAVQLRPGIPCACTCKLVNFSAIGWGPYFLEFHGKSDRI